MIRITIINILLFIGFILLFIFLAFGLSYLLGPGGHALETGAAYVGVCIFHNFLSLRMLRKRNLADLRHKALSVLLVTGAYVGYLFIYK